MTSHQLNFRVRNDTAVTLSTLAMTSRTSVSFVNILDGNLPQRSSHDELMDIEDSLTQHTIRFQFAGGAVEQFTFKWAWRPTDFGAEAGIELTFQSDRVVFLPNPNNDRWYQYNRVQAAGGGGGGGGGGWKRATDGGQATRDPGSSSTELLPGCMYLGLGYDLSGGFDIEGVQGMGRIFDTGQPGSIQYAGWPVPVNVRADTVGELQVETKVFESRSDLAQTFGAKAGLKAGYLGFSGSVSASFESIAKQLSEYFFGMSSYYSTGYEVRLDEATLSNAAAEVLADPDVTGLPETYNAHDPQNQAAFFRFFGKYGTVFVSSVRMGGRLFYNAWIDKSHGMTSTDVEASMKAEYAAIFSANASVTWKNVDNRWANNRRSSIQALGGDPTTLKGLSDPKQGDSYSAQYAAWVDSVPTNPGPVSFGLTDIAILFSGGKADAVRQAAADFRGRQLTVQARFDASTIQLNGTSAAMNSAAPTGAGFAVFSRADLSLLASGKVESTADGSGPWKGHYDALTTQLAPYVDNSSVIVAMLIWNSADVNSNWLAIPTPQLYDVLHSIGASDGLAQWGHPVASNAPHAHFGTGSMSAWGKFSYAVVGIPGSPTGDALEDFDRVRADHPSVALPVLLRPESIGTAICYRPS